MYKLAIVAFLITGLALAKPAERTEIKTEVSSKGLPTTTYRSDQFSPGVISEYLRVTRSSDRSKIVKMEYWYVYRNGNNTDQTKPVEIKFRKGAKYENEEVGYAGELLLPESDTYLSFRIAEGMLDLTHSKDRIQTFEPEQ